MNEIKIGITHKDIAKKFHISKSTVGWINRGVTWKHIILPEEVV